MKITSSNSYFQDLMQWADNKSKQFIMTDKIGDINIGDGGKWYGPSTRFSNRSRTTRKNNKPWTEQKKYIPSYWAGYYDRTAFYIRDFVHQAMGAALLGYNEENYQMMRSFVSLASEETGWYAPWALNFDGSVYYLDTPNYKRFVRELTGQYELVETICNLYFLTGDERYTSPMFLEFSLRILNDFTDSQDGIVLGKKNGIPEGVGNIWKGSSSYNESGAVLAEAGDCIAALYKSLSSFSNLLKSLGNTDEANKYNNRAISLKDYFNNEWSVAPDDGYVFGVDKKGKKYSKWTKSIGGIIGAETCFIMPLKEVTERGERNNRLLDEIDARAKDKKTCMPNIESYTYLPQLFFTYGQKERGWYWMKYIADRKDKPHVKTSQGNNGDYPEVSFTMISSAIQGMVGFSADSPSGAVYTKPSLPNDIKDICVKELSFGKYNIDISINSENSITLANNSNYDITWKCAFNNQFDNALIDGEDALCKTADDNTSFVEITVKKNMSVNVTVN